MRKLILSALALLATTTSAPAPTLANDPPPFVPVFSTNFPDPFILQAGNEFLAYATNANEGRANVQMARSTNLVDWDFVRDGERLLDAMPDLPPWAQEGWTWAPEVIRHQDRYLLYFTARERRSNKQCVGVAESASPRGPFTSAATEPLVCQRDTAPDAGGAREAASARPAVRSIPPSFATAMAISIFTIRMTATLSACLLTFSGRSSRRMG